MWLKKILFCFSVSFDNQNKIHEENYKFFIKCLIKKGTLAKLVLVLCLTISEKFSLKSTEYVY